MSEKQQHIYYLLAYDVAEGKWMNGDHIFGLLTEGKTVYQADSPSAEGEWIPLDTHVPELIDIDFENIQVLTKFLQEQNSKTDETD